MPNCKTDKDPCDVASQIGEAWNVCLPFGGRVWSDSNGVHAVGGIAPPDGVYGKVVIADGCIVGVEPEDVPIYTGNPCAPLPGNCSGNAMAAVNLEPMVASDVPAMGHVYMEAGAHVNIQGDGTADNPYVISADTGIHITSENHAIGITGEGTRKDPIKITHKLGHATTINGMTFDAFGHLVAAFDEPTAGAKGITGIVPGYGIDANIDIATGIAKISAATPPNAVKTTAEFGGYKAVIDEIGRFTSLKRTIDLKSATLACGATNVTINSTGSIINYEETFDTGSSYLCILNKPDGPLERRGAEFTLRLSTELLGLCITDKDLGDAVFYLDGQKCNRIGQLFWGSGYYLHGTHTLEVQATSDIDLAVIIKATSIVKKTW